MLLNQFIKRNRKNIILFLLEAYRLDGALISDLSNIRYLSGFKGENALLLLTREDKILFTDARYYIEAKRTIPKSIKLVIYQRDMIQEISLYIKILKIKNLGVEETSITYNKIKRLILDCKKIKIKDISDVILSIRSIKREDEIKKVKKALSIAEKSFSELEIKPGMRENEISALLEYLMKKNGAEDISFPTIVASGENSALPHYFPSNRKVKKNDVVLIDFGAVYEGYHSDTTRVVFTGKVKEKIREMYNTVKSAHLYAVEILKKIREGNLLDFKVDEYLKSKGFKDGLIHSIGHGVGLNIHEFPILNRNKEFILEEGMIFTIEPGIYIEGVGGIRLENMYYIDKKNNIINLNKLKF